jgi:RNA polymerase primary sigma factor
MSRDVRDGSSPVDDRLLLERARAGDPRARERVVDVFAPSVAGIARRYRNTPGVCHAELMQEGVVGLLRALERYDPAREVPFWAYASWWVRQAMQDLVSELARPVVLSDRALRQLARVKEARRSYVQLHRCEPSAGELADETGLAREQIARLVGVDRTPRGLGEPVGDDASAGTTLGDLIVDGRADDDYDRVFRRAEIEELRSLPECLTSRERRILDARLGVGCEQRTLQEIGRGLGLSAERVRQLEQRALEKLRAALEHPEPEPQAG